MRWPKYVALPVLGLAFVSLLPLLCSAQGSGSVHLKRYAMGTVFEIVVYDDDSTKAEAAAHAALDEAVRLDRMMSNYKADSELSQMNRSAHFQPVRISRELYDIIEQSLSYSRVSGGQFDISVGPLVDLWKAALAGGPIPSADEQTAARGCVGYQQIELLPPDRIQFLSNCMRLDLGSIGKGYAVDRMVELLKARGIRRAYIDAGGSTIYGLGYPKSANAWRVRLRDPSGKLFPQTSLMNSSVSTSEQSAPSPLQGDAPGHIVLPGTGKPLQTRNTVSVTAQSATASDALSTTLLLLGPTKGAALLKTLHGISAIWIDPDGQRLVAGDSAVFHLSGEQQSTRTSQPAKAAVEMSNTRQDSPR